MAEEARLLLAAAALALLAAGGSALAQPWLPPMHDTRDFTENHKKIKPVSARLAKRFKASKPQALTAPPTTVDLRQWCSGIKDQGQLGSCTAHAATGIVEYFQRRAFGKHLDASRLFVYKTTRNLIGVEGDSGAWLRNTMGALVLCGVPGERYWEYTDATPDFDREPPQFIYSIADNYEALKYFAHDPQSKNIPFGNVLDSRIDLWSKISFPLVNFIMVLVGIPFALKTGRHSGIGAGAASASS